MKRISIVLLLFLLLFLSSCSKIEFRNNEVHFAQGMPYFENEKLKIRITVLNGYTTPKQVDTINIKIELIQILMEEEGEPVLASQMFIIDETIEGRTRTIYILIFDADNVNYTEQELHVLEIYHIDSHAVTETSVELESSSLEE